MSQAPSEFFPFRTFLLFLVWSIYSDISASQPNNRYQQQEQRSDFNFGRYKPVDLDKFLQAQQKLPILYQQLTANGDLDTELVVDWPPLTKPPPTKWGAKQLSILPATYLPDDVGWERHKARGAQ
jgi:hypothetical protein